MNAKNKTMLYIPLSLLLIIVACSLILMMSSCASQATSNAGAGEVPEAAPANVSTPTQEVQSVADTESETAAEQSEQSQSDEVAKAQRQYSFLRVWCPASSARGS